MIKDSIRLQDEARSMRGRAERVATDHAGYQQAAALYEIAAQLAIQSESLPKWEKYEKYGPQA